MRAVGTRWWLCAGQHCTELVGAQSLVPGLAVTKRFVDLRLEPVDLALSMSLSTPRLVEFSSSEGSPFFWVVLLQP